MRSLGDRDRKKVVVALIALLAAEACARRSGKPVPTTPASTLAQPPAAVQSTDAYTGSLRLYEVRVIETAGQRSILFRFSRPPEGVDYFPLRGPSRLVIDVKGPVESLAKIQNYKAADSIVAAVRVGLYQGRMRLVIDLKGTEAPQYSVDNYDTLLTVFIGEKNGENGFAESNAQVLYLAQEARNGHPAQLVAHGERPKAIPAVASSSIVEKPTAENTLSAVAANSLPAAPEDETPLPTPVRTQQPVPGEPQLEPSHRADAPASSAPQAVDKPLTLAQAEPPTTPEPEARKEASPLREEPIALDAMAATATPEESAAPAAEFRPSSMPAYSGRKISLDFKNADIHDVLRILADVSGLNIVATDDVKARVTLRLVEVPWDQALDVVLQANGLEKSQTGNVITISTTRRLESERNARLAAKNAEQRLASLETEYVKVNYVKAEDVVKLITQEAQQRAAAAAGGGAAAPRGGVAARTTASATRAASGGGTGRVALMSPRGTIAAEPTTNIIVIRDVRENIAAVRELIRNLDVQTPQVVIESYLVTTNENLARDLGIQWGYQYVASPETGNATGVNFPGRVGVGGVPGLLGSGAIPFVADFPATTTPGSGSALDLVLGSLDGSQTLNLRLSALERQGKARVISRPRVVTLNNKSADIRSRRVVRVPIIAGSLTVGGAGTSGGGNAFQEFDVGITLKVTPQISYDGFVLLDIDAESSELASASVQASGTTTAFPVIPDELRRTASSNVLIRAGDTFVLGGILQDNLRQDERGIPFLRDTPGIGWLFKGRTNSRVKDELLVFITPKLVAGVSTTGLPSAQQLWEERPKAAPSPAQPVQP